MNGEKGPDLDFRWDVCSLGYDEAISFDGDGKKVVVHERFYFMWLFPRNTQHSSGAYFTADDQEKRSAAV
jgi:hypothetical protein